MIFHPHPRRPRAAAAATILLALAVLGGSGTGGRPTGAALARVVAEQPPTMATTLPNGRLVTPVGTLHDLGDFPLGLAISPDGVLAVAINSGQGFGLNNGFASYCTVKGQGGAPCPYASPANPVLGATAGSRAAPAPDESLSVLNLRTGVTRQVMAVPTGHDPARHGAGSYNFFYSGVVFSPNGRHLYAAGGGNDAVYDFPVRGDVVAAAPAKTIILPSNVPSFIGSGISKNLAVTADGRYLLVTHELNDSLEVVDTASYQVQSLSFGIPLLSDGYPYGVAVSADGRTAYVALQGAGKVAVVDLRAGRGSLRGTVRVGDHPTAVALSPDDSQLYVANANDDTLAIVTTANLRLAASLPLHVLPREALGSVPDAVAVAPDGRRLYVALAGDNAVAVLEAPGQSTRSGSRPTSPPAGAFRLAGFVSAGWYPSAVALSGDGRSLYVVNAKGLGSRPRPVTSSFQYVGNNMPGLLQVLPAPDSQALLAGAAVARQNIQFAAAADNHRSAHNPVPADSGGQSPITHVLLIVRENRTFDQVLGDAGADLSRSRTELDGEPAYTVFGRQTTPNAHALVGDPLPGAPDPAYATSDNFFSDGEASIQGHYWTSSANVTDYVEKSWRLYYSPRHHLQDPLSSLAEPKACSIFQSALRRETASNGAFTFRDYGEVIGIANPVVIGQAVPIPGNASPGVAEHCTPIPGANVNLKSGSIFTFDTDNRLDARAFLADNGLNADGSRVPGSAAQLRNFSYLTLPGDHTGGLAFSHTPRSRVSQNDAAVGTIVQALSHSAYWSSTAIFVMEDDSQDGLDHRDGHRNLLYVVSPYSKHVGTDGKPGFISHTHYSQASVLKTIELILGLPFLSSYDQNAAALYNLFQDKNAPAMLTAPDLAPYSLQPAPPFIDETSDQYRQANPSQAALPAAESQQLNLRLLDVAGPLLEVVDWQLAHPTRQVPEPLQQELRAWKPGSFAGADD